MLIETETEEAGSKIEPAAGTASLVIVSDSIADKESVCHLHIFRLSILRSITLSLSLCLYHNLSLYTTHSLYLMYTTSNVVT